MPRNKIPRYLILLLCISVTVAGCKTMEPKLSIPSLDEIQTIYLLPALTPIEMQLASHQSGYVSNQRLRRVVLWEAGSTRTFSEEDEANLQRYRPMYMQAQNQLMEALDGQYQEAGLTWFAINAALGGGSGGLVLKNGRTIGWRTLASYRIYFDFDYDPEVRELLRLKLSEPVKLGDPNILFLLKPNPNCGKPCEGKMNAERDP